MTVNSTKMNSIHVDQLETDIQGLKYKPSIYNNDLDEYKGYDEDFKFNDFSPKNQQKLFEKFSLIKKKCKCIVEIGICQHPNYFRTSTCVLLNNKLLKTVYIGIDIEDRSFLNNPSKNIYTIQTNCRKKQKIYDLMKSLKLKNIDFLFIDGDHTVNMATNDWSYSEKLSDFGIVGFHDTTWHIGPYFVFEAIDENLYTKEKYFDDIQGDWGISFAIKK